MALLRQPMPKNCEASDERREVDFDLEFEGSTWKGSVSYEALARMFTAPRQDTAASEAREVRQQLVCHSKGIARLAIEQIRSGAKKAKRLVIS